MVGDSWTDMRSAQAAGVKGAFCSFGFGDIKDAPSTAVLHSFKDLLEL
jgi:phosphoglycolate phosphatase-like HAD superfamily hydrolase